MVVVSVTFFLGYRIGFENGYDPIAQLHFMIPINVVTIAGISGIEGLLGGKSASAAKGFASDGNYQRQSAIAMLSYAFIAVVVRLGSWGIAAELTIFLAFAFFLVFSGVNHAVDAVRRKDFAWQNVNRPFIALLLVAGTIYPVVLAPKGL
jgi:hypothetical protein